jgi:hypothetical protein
MGWPQHIREWASAQPQVLSTITSMPQTAQTNPGFFLVDFFLVVFLGVFFFNGFFVGILSLLIRFHVFNLLYEGLFSQIFQVFFYILIHDSASSNAACELDAEYIDKNPLQTSCNFMN